MSAIVAQSKKDWLNLLDLSAIADPNDKLRECEFFFDLASHEVDRDRFRWLTTSFLNSAYSFLECSALRAYVSIMDPKSGALIKDSSAIETLEKYIKLSPQSKDPYFIKTQAKHPLVSRLYELRKRSVHHFPLSVMITGTSLPENFHIGETIGEGEPAILLLQSILCLLNQINGELQS